MEIFDMGRTDLPDQGLRYFKSHWGAEEIPLTYSTIYLTSQASPTKGRIQEPSIQAFSRTILRRMPIWVCRLAGELFYQYLT